MKFYEAKQIIENVFEKSFDKDQFQYFIRNLLNCFILFQQLIDCMVIELYFEKDIKKTGHNILKHLTHYR